MSTHRGLFITFEGGEGSGKSTQVKSLLGRLRRRRIPAKDVREPGGTPFGDSLRLLLKFSNVPLTPEAELWLFNASRAQLVSEVITPYLERGYVVISDRFTDSTLAYQGYGHGLPMDKVRMLNAAAIDGVEVVLTILLDIPPEEGLKRQFTVRERFEWGTPKAPGRSTARISELQAALPGMFQGPPNWLPRLGEEPRSIGNPWPATPQFPEGEWHTIGDFLVAPIDEDSPQAYLPGLELEQAVIEELVTMGGLVEQRIPEEIMDFHRRVHRGYLELAKAEPSRWLRIDARLPQEEISELIWQRVEQLLNRLSGEEASHA